MDFLKNLNPDPRDDDIFLEELSHTYFINGETGYTSVTTFVGGLFEKFDANSVIHNMRNSQKWKKSPYYGMTNDEIKDIWEKKKNGAANSGTQLHLDIEKFYNNIYTDNSSDEFRHFLEFAEKYKNLIPFRTEKIIYSKEYKLAGSIDMLFMDVGNQCLQLYDWKRVKNITKTSPWNKWIQNKTINYLPDSNYWHYALQLNIYKFIYNKEYKGHIIHLNLVSLHPDNKSFIHIPVIDLQDEVEKLLEERKKQLFNT